MCSPNCKIVFLSFNIQISTVYQNPGGQPELDGGGWKLICLIFDIQKYVSFNVNTRLSQDEGDALHQCLELQVNTMNTQFNALTKYWENTYTD